MGSPCQETPHPGQVVGLVGVVDMKDPQVGVLILGVAVLWPRIRVDFHGPSTVCPRSLLVSPLAFCGIGWFCGIVLDPHQKSFNLFQPFVDLSNPKL